MVVFWILATVMTAVALAFVLVPLLRPRTPTGPSLVEANLEVLRGQRREIEADVANGSLPADARDEALAELVDRAQSDLQAPATTPAPAPRKPWVAAAVVAVAIPVVTFGMYLAVGSPAATEARIASHEAGGGMDDKQILAMVEALSKKVHERPDDVQGWSLLARSMASLGRFEESKEAYEHLAKLAPNDAQVLADYADVLGMTQGRSLAGKPFELIKSALAIDPKNPKALALAGSAALDAGDYPASLGYWQTLAAQLPPDSEDVPRVQAVMAEVRERAAAAGKALPAAGTPKLAQAAAKAAAKSVSGQVTISPAMAAKASSGDTVFVFARAVQGSRAPLAVVRTTVGALPLKFALDDSMAMSPQNRLSGAESVRIEARVSKSGSALPQTGDLIGMSDVVKPGAQGVNIVVDKVVQ